MLAVVIKVLATDKKSEGPIPSAVPPRPLTKPVKTTGRGNRPILEGLSHLRRSFCFTNYYLGSERDLYDNHLGLCDSRLPTGERGLRLEHPARPLQRRRM